MRLKQEKRNTYRGIALIGLSIALLLDIKYKGLVYQLVAPKKIQ